jgi:hypothetical protein
MHTMLMLQGCAAFLMASSSCYGGAQILFAMVRVAVKAKAHHVLQRLGCQTDPRKTCF